MEILMDLPLKTYAEFEEFSETIKSGGKIRRVLTNGLQDFKVKDDTAKSIRRMMAFLMTDQCADEMVWIQPREGTKKPAVHETYFMKYVTWVIKKTFPSDENVTNEYIETALQNWITRSSDRLRNATKKKSKKRSKQLPPDEPAQDDKNIPDEEFE
ncbi:hypothetical protein QAD02_008814 [Eretmocerus hayati]|uniref:Uncharacterized protein n=1 Tax=Eretmocerus hayati TaxID=131215 RepID=A0ACC2N9Z0_9HYME|nr:hypothetical protein QAD02_008814 [Eretmocerus hayati]